MQHTFSVFRSGHPRGCHAVQSQAASSVEACSSHARGLRFVTTKNRQSSRFRTASFRWRRVLMMLRGRNNGGSRQARRRGPQKPRRQRRRRWMRRRWGRRSAPLCATSCACRCSDDPSRARVCWRPGTAPPLAPPQKVDFQCLDWAFQWRRLRRPHVLPSPWLINMAASCCRSVATRAKFAAAQTVQRLRVCVLGRRHILQAA